MPEPPSTPVAYSDGSEPSGDAAQKPRLTFADLMDAPTPPKGNWACGSCGRFVPSATVVKGGGGPPDYEPYASGTCSKCGRQDVYGVVTPSRAGRRPHPDAMASSAPEVTP